MKCRRGWVLWGLYRSEGRISAGVYSILTLCFKAAKKGLGVPETVLSPKQLLCAGMQLDAYQSGDSYRNLIQSGSVIRRVLPYVSAWVYISHCVTLPLRRNTLALLPYLATT